MYCLISIFCIAKPWSVCEPFSKIIFDLSGGRLILPRSISLNHFICNRGTLPILGTKGCSPASLCPSQGLLGNYSRPSQRLSILQCSASARLYRSLLLRICLQRVRDSVYTICPV